MTQVWWDEQLNRYVGEYTLELPHVIVSQRARWQCGGNVYLNLALLTAELLALLGEEGYERTYQPFGYSAKLEKGSR